MCSDVIHDPRFAQLLYHFDVDLARQAQAKGCLHCGGRLDSARYARKPRGGGPDFGDEYNSRQSYCCAVHGCRKRMTPRSLRFLARKVYLGAVVALAVCLMQGLSAANIADLGLVLEVPRRTLKRWRVWWQDTFVRTPFWQLARARLMPPVQLERLPLSLLERFAGSDWATRVARLLEFIASLSTASAG